MKLTSPRSSLYFIVHPSTQEPGRFQLTLLDGASVPLSHTTWDNAEDAMASAMGRRVNGEPPVGSRSYRPVTP